MTTEGRKLLSVVLSIVLTTASLHVALGYQAPASVPAAVSGYPTAPAPKSASELQALVAPIALYPDQLVAIVLGAATFPDQVAVADYWLGEHKNLAGIALNKAVGEQQWDVSVKALTQFPSVLHNMAQNLIWTSSLGEVYHDQQAGVMGAIQTLRAQAKAAGNLKSTPQIIVQETSPQTIVIEPANPEIVYVPAYNPMVIYGTTYVTPGYSTGDMVATSLLSFGAGVAVGAAVSGGWGWSSWGCNWHGGAVVYQQNNFYGNGGWHGGYYGSSGSAYGAYGSAHYGSAYNPSTGTYARGGSVSTPYGRTEAGQAYNPNTGAFGATHETQNAYGNYGSSEFSKNGETVNTQHQTTAQGSVGTVQTSQGGKGIAAAGPNGNGAAAGETANGNKYTDVNGNAYKNTGSGWEKDNNGTWSNVQKPTSSSSGSGGSSAFSGLSGHSGGYGNGGGWSSQAASSRGWGSMRSSGFHGGRFGGGEFGGGGFRR